MESRPRLRLLWSSGRAQVQGMSPRKILQQGVPAQALERGSQGDLLREAKGVRLLWRIGRFPLQVQRVQEGELLRQGVPEDALEGGAQESV